MTRMVGKIDPLARVVRLRLVPQHRRPADDASQYDQRPLGKDSKQVHRKVNRAANTGL